MPCWASVDFLLLFSAECSKYTTMEKFITIKIWAKTLQKLRLVSAYRGKSIVSILDETITEVLEQVENERKNDNPNK